MFELINMAFVSAPALPDDAPIVHPFYITSFEKLYGINKTENLPNIVPTDNHKLLLSVIHQSIKCYKNKIMYFYDIRTTEEYGSPAPEYKLLYDAGLKNLSPISINGEGGLSLPFALHILMQFTKENQIALVCCSEMYNKYDLEFKNKKREACSFLVHCTNDYDKSENHFIIQNVRYNIKIDDIISYIMLNHIDSVFTDDERLNILPLTKVFYTGDGFVRPFIALNKMNVKNDGFNSLIVYHCNNKYGFVHLSKGVNIEKH